MSKELPVVETKGVRQRKIFAIKPIEHDPGTKLPEDGKWILQKVIKQLRLGLLPGQTIVVHADTKCARETAYIISSSLTELMAIECPDMDSRKPHDSEPRNRQALIDMLGNLVGDSDNVIVVTHVGDLSNYPIFTSFFLEEALPITASSCELQQGGVVTVECEI